VSLGLLVGGVTYRNPALHAKITATLDIVSGGRAWHALARRGLRTSTAPTLRLPATGSALRDARGRRSDRARHVHAGARHLRGPPFPRRWGPEQPQPLRGDIPIVIGGSGERKTLRLVAQYADGCNVFGDAARVKHLMEVLAGHCEHVGREPAEITKTRLGILAIAPTHEAAMAKVEFLRRAGMPEQRLSAMVMAGDPDGVAEQAAAFTDAGIEGLTMTIPDVHDLEVVALAGRTLGPVFAAQPA
jgi:alkanesulfonate monooxygenase SsuD/methylene tetrahydromethanopterin reductase-like flavin-dependent oxidoreductase (luciferase family)